MKFLINFALKCMWIVILSFPCKFTWESIETSFLLSATLATTADTCDTSCRLETLTVDHELTIESLI